MFGFPLLNGQRWVAAAVSSYVTELVKLWQRRKLHANSVWPLKDSGGKDKLQGTFSTRVSVWHLHTLGRSCFLNSTPGAIRVTTGSIRSSKWANQVISPLILTWWSSQNFRPWLHLHSGAHQALTLSWEDSPRVSWGTRVADLAIMKCYLKVLNKVLRGSFSSLGKGEFLLTPSPQLPCHLGEPTYNPGPWES